MKKEKANEAKTKVWNIYPQLKNKKVYFWAPTFRRQGSTCYLQDKLDFDAIESLLKEDEILLIKYHPVIYLHQKEECDFSRYRKIINTTEYESIYDLLCAADTFMTDYSSAMHYALLMDKPICYLITDWEQYSKQQGILLEKDSLPGPVCTNNNPGEFINAHRNASADTEKYRVFKQFHVGACSPNSRAMILRAIEHEYKRIAEI